MTDTDTLDQSYEQLQGKGPEFEGWLSNHGPMVADALVRLGHGVDVHNWVCDYVERLEPAPTPRWELTDSGWREELGDASRLGDWCALLAEQVHSEPWQLVLERWWPRLLPGAVGAATHGLIRTGHAVRAVREQATDLRLEELGNALAYWAARWQPLPAARPPRGTAEVGDAMDALPAREWRGGIRTRLAGLAENAVWPGELGAARPVPDPARIPAALDALVDAAVTRYGRWGHGNPIMLVHAATAPRAVALVVPALPERLWPTSYDAAWGVTAALAAVYRPPQAATCQPTTAAPAEVIEQAVASGDAHAIKFTEVAVESHRRGNPCALPAAARAVSLIMAS